MDPKLREDLFKKYVQTLESQLEEGGGGQQKTGETGLQAAATALLSVYQVDPNQRFRLVHFYEVAENALRTLRSSSLQTLETAFFTLETVCKNLLLYPWKKEFRSIKTFTGPYVYYLQSAMCDSDLRSLLRSMGYSREQELQFHIRDHPVGANHLRQLAFELFLARMECRLLKEVVALAGVATSEVEAVEMRRVSREDATGCAEALHQREVLAGEVSRLSVRQPETERAYLRRTSRPSKSVDVTDGAGHWQPANKPVLKASLSLRKEPLFVDAEEDLQDEIIRPNISLLSVAGPPYSPVADFFPVQPPPAELPQSYSYHLSSLDGLDIYTDRGGYRPASSRSQNRDPRDSRENWGSKSPAAPSIGMKCQGCGVGCSSLTSCQKCDMILCPNCHAVDPSPCCGLQDFPKSSRPSDGYLSAKEKFSVYSNAHSQLSEKPLTSSKLFTSKPSSSNNSSIGGSRCGFCNKPGATHTCLNCSKVSCDSCMNLYAKDVCTRKSAYHNFVPNHQLNYKSSSISHLVYR
ncbi:spermatogenesis-associated protein 2 [Amia ocellicauda]|uniref:spermatogenesis-associated protein 2 n=1 Tax=Amia ocellicauda TaxID=2972642 RepID=UPI003464807C